MIKFETAVAKIGSIASSKDHLLYHLRVTHRISYEGVFIFLRRIVAQNWLKTRSFS